MRVMILSALYPPLIHGGAEKAAWQLAEALVKEGDDVSVITLYAEKEESTETLNGVRVYRLPMENLYFPFGSDVKPSSSTRLRWHINDMWNRKLAARVGRVLDIEKPEVVNSHLIIGFSAAVWKEVRKRKIRLVHTMHDYYLMCSRADIFRNGKTCTQQCAGCKALTFTRKRSARKLDAVISVSGFVLDAHRTWGYFPDVPGSIIYNVSTLPPEEIQPESSAREGAPLVFGFIGRLSEQKGVRTVLESTRLLQDENWRLRIAGTGLESFVKELRAEFTDPRIEWLGFCSSGDFFHSIDVNIIPSVWADPLPYVVIESHLYGKPILCSTSGGIPEAASLGKTIARFPPKDVPALAALMNTALSNPREWRQGGFRDRAALEMFSVKTIVAKYRAVYQDSEQGQATL